MKTAIYSAIVIAVTTIILMCSNSKSVRSVTKDESDATEDAIMQITIGSKERISNGLPEPFTTDTLNMTEKLSISLQNNKSNGSLPSNNKKPVILILTYMRSGSTFTADLLARGDGAFLFYEPLHNLGNLRKENQVLNLTSGESKFFVKEQFSDVAEEVMESYLRCKIDHSYCEGYTDSFLQMGHSKLFATCIRTLERDQALCPEYFPCQMILKNECTSSSYVVMKTIRASMHVVRYLFTVIPNLRVIHLVRDARATIRSQKKYGITKGIDINKFAFNFCQRVLDDIQSKMEIEEEFPGRILQIRYEDLSMNPLKTLWKMYAFAGINFTEEIAEYVWNVTYTGKTCKGFFCTKRENSTIAMLQWRKEIPYELVKIIDENCVDVYHQLGYLPAKNEKQLRDWTESLFL